MQANELRIGNLASINTGSTGMKICEILGIINNKVAVEINVRIVSVEMGNVEAIALTEEWLLKFGFEKVRDEKSPYPDGDYTLVHKKFTVYTKEHFTYNSIHGWWFFNKQLDNQDLCKYVHQLQNLYFALTGEELTISA
jgi:hypothetical protein